MSENSPGRAAGMMCGDGPDAMYCEVFWSKSAECEALRTLAAEILDAFGPSGSGHTARVGQVQIAKWRTRAGIAP